MEAPKMSFIDAIVTCFKKYVDFDGRARRREYWFFTLFTGLITALLEAIFGEGNTVGSIFAIAVFLPGLAVFTRRMHDIGKTGWAYLLNLIPIVGQIILLVRVCRDGEPGPNAYGPNPKGAYAGAETVDYTPAEPAYAPSQPEAKPEFNDAPAAETPDYSAAEAHPLPREQEDPFNKDNVKARYCTNCGAPINPGARFCTNCGATITD